MLNLTYLAVLEPGDDGGYGISFPDLPGCFSASDNLAEASEMAAEAAELHVYGMERDGEAIPEPSVSLPGELTAGMVVMPITIHPDLYKLKRDNERVKTNTTLPAWLKRLAEEKNVNFSRLLESALIDYLNLPSQSST
jgi:predicted RNase H-like HicB family nuclease